MDPAKPAMRVLNELGWRWHQNGAMLTVSVDGHQQQVFVPLTKIRIEFGEGMASVGCPLAPSVGEMYTVSGLFSSIKRAVRKAKKVRHAVVRRTVPRAIRKRAAKIRRSATRFVRRRAMPHARRLKRFAQSPVARYGAMALSAFPPTAPAGLSMMAAQNTLAAIDRGNKAAQLVRRGIRRPGDVASMMGAQAQRRGVAALAQQARRGNPQAQQFMGALQQFSRMAG